MAQAHAKITVKSHIPYYPDIRIIDAPCDTDSTWEEFFKGFGINFALVSPNERFVIRSRKGHSTMNEKVDSIASKYIQKYKVLVRVEIQNERYCHRSIKSTDSTKRPRRRKPAAAAATASGGEIPQDQKSTTDCPHLLSALQKPYCKEPTVAQRLKLLREVLCNPPIPEYVPSPFPSFASITQPSQLNFETRVERVEDYNVIQRSSVVWQQQQQPIETLKCFSMSDEDFIL